MGKKEAHNNVHKLNNGVDVKTYKFNPAERRRIREQYGIDDKDILVGHIGRFSKQKNHDYILRIFAECQNRNKNSVLMLVGTGERINEIKEKVDALGLFEKVIFTGVRTDIPDVLAAMDCFILPSLFEGMPNTAIEAQASGLKCLLADTITNEAKITNLCFLSSTFRIC